MIKGRLEAFSDGVIAIIVTIMVLELKGPHGTSSRDLLEVVPHFLSYLLSFLLVAIMWLNHHHIMERVRSSNNRLLWANHLILFSMSLIPFATAYIGGHYTEPLPVAFFGIIMLLCGSSFTVFRYAAAARYEKADRVRIFHVKDMVSTCLYLLSIPLAYVTVFASFSIYVFVAVIYFLPGLKAEHGNKPE